MAKVQITVIYEYEIKGEYPKNLTNKQCMELDKKQVEEQGILFDEVADIKESKWKLIE